MKKLFSIALVIAMAISCLAIFPAAATDEIGEGSTFVITHTIEGNILTLVATADVTILNPSIDYCGFDWYMEFDPAQVTCLGTETVQYDNIREGEYVEDFTEDASFNLGAMAMDWTVSPEDGGCKGFMSVQFQLADTLQPGDEVVFVDGGSGCGTADAWVELGYTDYVVTIPAATEEPTYEAPAAASYQTLAGCEVCGTAAGVRFIAEVDAAADEYGMYITANGTTVTLSSADATFVAKEETDTTVTFTAVIFSDMKFEVVVFEKYGNTEVTSTAGTN